MIKVMLIDADGVTISDRGGRFSDLLVAEYGANRAAVNSFFLDVFPQCSIGKLDLFVELDKIYSSFGFSSAQAVLDAWLMTVTADDDMISYIQKIRHGGYAKCCLATDNEMHRTNRIKRVLATDDNFDEVFASCFVGYTKSDPEFYKHVVAQLGVLPSEILLVDDSMDNCEQAATSGLVAHPFVSIRNFEKFLDDSPLCER